MAKYGPHTGCHPPLALSHLIFDRSVFGYVSEQDSVLSSQEVERSQVQTYEMATVYANVTCFGDKTAGTSGLCQRDDLCNWMSTWQLYMERKPKPRDIL